MKNPLRFFLLLIVLTGCEKELLNDVFENNARGNFEAFWTEYDRYYGAFEPKHINWDSLKIVYGAGLKDNSSDEELFSAVTGLLDCLNDGHSDIYAENTGYFRSWNRRNKSYFSDYNTLDFSHVVELQNLIKSKYLQNHYTSHNESGWLFGSISYENHKVGYLLIPTFLYGMYPNDFILEAADFFKDCQAVIIDIRYNGGGATETLVHAINTFSSEEKLYMKSKFRNGPEHNDFTGLFDHYTRPRTRNFENIPVAILINSYSASSSEHFLLGMLSQPNVITVGDTTCGAFSGIRDRLLPNGWVYRLGAQVVCDTIGNPLSDENGNYLEGIGIAPQYFEPDRLLAVRNQMDMPLETALKEVVKRIE